MTMSTNYFPSTVQSIESSTPGPKKTNLKELPLEFEPHQYSVICGQNTREVLQSSGNQRFRITVQMFLDEYQQANGKSAKSATVTKVMNIIRAACPEGGAFIKHEGGRWWEVSDRVAREKVGALFRDCLHQEYRSSSKAKTARKQKAKKQQLETRAPRRMSLLHAEILGFNQGKFAFESISDDIWDM